MPVFLKPGAFAPALFVLALCAGCSKQTTPTSNAAASKRADAPSDAQHALKAKLGAYIDCFNRVDLPVHTGAKHYIGSIDDAAAGPSGRETRVAGPYDISDFDMKECDAPVSAAAAAQPSLPALDAAARQYYAALQALRPISHQVADYYARQDDEDDQFAKGKRLHAPLMAALERYAEASSAFGAELEAQNDAAHRETLKTLEREEGRTREYYRLSMMLDAKQLTDVLQEEQFDTARAHMLLDGFNRLSDEAHAKVADQEPDKLKWNSFETAAEDFRRQAKARVKRVVDNTPYSRIEEGWLDSPSLAPEGSPRKLLNTYNALVSESNRQ
ncbi:MULTISPECIES: YiiG family protein [Xanthomonas]|uniref:YiiG family protein n=1 Tax=Xanthomonas dyei TaxID=743699 RepID=A0ABZ0DAG8_9XANT|nr:YiiG family protein [Xanthomonas dyei]MCC4634570.1 YiiG family protein [Xanthomonas dyei pv. eucalypti]WOB25592.1 YiiG family protein [Xanthomonas dyei]WOB53218.1 YiiG family protein [Xanthomonas dyei]